MSVIFEKDVSDVTQHITVIEMDGLQPNIEGSWMENGDVFIKKEASEVMGQDIISESGIGPPQIQSELEVRMIQPKPESFKSLTPVFMAVIKDEPYAAIKDEPYAAIKDEPYAVIKDEPCVIPFEKDLIKMEQKEERALDETGCLVNATSRTNNDDVASTVINPAIVGFEDCDLHVRPERREHNKGTPFCDSPERESLSCSRVPEKEGNSKHNMDSVLFHVQGKIEKCPEENPHENPACNKVSMGKPSVQGQVTAVYNLGKYFFSCHICGKGFRYRRNLKRHKTEIHEGLGRHKRLKCGKELMGKPSVQGQVTAVHSLGKYFFLCHICGKGFRYRWTLKRHKTEIHEGLGRHKRLKCDKDFMRKQSVHRHMRNVHNVETCSISCHIQGKQFTHRRSLTTHMRQVHVELGRHHCLMCGKVFIKKASIVEHMAAKHNPGNYPSHNIENPSLSCHIGGAEFTHRRSLERHNKQANEEVERYVSPCSIQSKVPKRHLSPCSNKLKRFARNHKCYECCKTYKSRIDLHRHIALMTYSHSQLKLYSCGICNIYLSRSSKIGFFVCKHMSHNLESSPFKCSSCGAIFDNALCLESHKHYDHRKNKSSTFICSFCGQSSESRIRHFQHQLSHYTKKGLQCNLCGKYYASTRHLINHKIKVHRRRDTQRECVVCGMALQGMKRCCQIRPEMKGFKAKRKIEGPLQEHSCEMCGKSFKHRYYIAHHVKAHVKQYVSNHKCNICGKSFLLKHHLAQHMPTHSAERPYLCDACGISFKYKHNLENHKATHK